MGHWFGFGALTCLGLLLLLRFPAKGFEEGIQEKTVGELLAEPTPFSLPPVGFGLLPVPRPRSQVQSTFPEQEGLCQWHTLMLEALTSEEPTGWRRVDLFNFELSDPRGLFESIAYLKQHPECLPVGTLRQCPEELAPAVVEAPARFAWSHDNSFDESLWRARRNLIFCLDDIIRLRLVRATSNLRGRTLASLQTREELTRVVQAKILQAPRPPLYDLLPLVEKWASFSEERELSRRTWISLRYAAMTMAATPEERARREADFQEALTWWQAHGGMLGSLPTTIKVAALRLSDPDKSFRAFTESTDELVHEQRLYYHAWNLAAQGETERATSLLSLLTPSSFDGYALLAQVAKARLGRGLDVTRAFFEHSVSIGLATTLVLDYDADLRTSSQTSMDYGPLTYRDVYNEREFPELGLAFVRQRRDAPTPWQEREAQMEDALRAEGLPTAHPR